MGLLDQAKGAAKGAAEGTATDLASRVKDALETAIVEVNNLRPSLVSCGFTLGDIELEVSASPTVAVRFDRAHGDAESLATLLEGEELTHTQRALLGAMQKAYGMEEMIHRTGHKMSTIRVALGFPPSITIVLSAVGPAAGLEDPAARTDDLTQSDPQCVAAQPDETAEAAPASPSGKTESSHSPSPLPSARSKKTMALASVPDTALNPVGVAPRIGSGVARPSVAQLGNPLAAGPTAGGPTEPGPTEPGLTEPGPTEPGATPAEPAEAIEPLSRPQDAPPSPYGPAPQPAQRAGFVQPPADARGPQAQPPGPLRAPDPVQPVQPPARVQPRPAAEPMPVQAEQPRAFVARVEQPPEQMQHPPRQPELPTQTHQQPMGQAQAQRGQPQPVRPVQPTQPEQQTSSQSPMDRERPAQPARPLATRVDEAPSPPAQAPYAPAPTPGPLAAGSWVYVAWPDGNRYAGQITNATLGQYLVRFEDGSNHWVPDSHVTPAG